MDAERIEQLLARHFDGDLSPEESQELGALLLADEALRERFWRDARFHALVRRSLARKATSRQLASSTVASPTPSQPDASPSPAPRTAATGWLRGLAKDFAREPVALAVIVLVMISGGVLFWNLPRLNRPQPVAQQPVPGEPGASKQGEPRASARGGSTASGGASNSPVGPNIQHTVKTPPGAGTAEQQRSAPGSPVVARLTRSAGSTWAQQEALVEGTELKIGQKLSIKQGVAEITFASGATVILEGPAEFKVGTWNVERGIEKDSVPASNFQLPTSKNSCSLALGKLFARVPTQAHGFTVQTPTLQIVDLGTEFGVAVMPADQSKIGAPAAAGHPKSKMETSVQVFQGHVDVIPQLAQAPQQPPVQRIRLGAGEGVRAEPEVPIQKIESDASAFIRELPGTADAIPAQPAGVLKPLSTWPKDSPLAPGDIVAITSPTLRLLKIDPKTGEQKLLAQGSRYTGGRQEHDHGLRWQSVAIEPDGHVLVGSDGLHGREAAVLRIDPRTGAINVLAGGGLLAGQGEIRGLAVADDGTIYATFGAVRHGEQDYLLSINPRGGALKPIARFGPGGPGLAIDVGGKDFFSTTAGAALCHIRNGTGSTWDVGERLRAVFGVAVDPRGRIFAASNRRAEVDRGQTRQVVEVSRQPDHATTVVASLPAAEASGNWSLAVGSDGNLIAGGTATDPRIYRIDVAAGRAEPVASGGQIAGQIGVAVVPGRLEK